MDGWIKVIAIEWLPRAHLESQTPEDEEPKSRHKETTLSSKYQELAYVYFRQDVFYKPEILMKQDSMVI